MDRLKASGIDPAEDAALLSGRRKISYLFADPTGIEIGWNVLLHTPYSPELVSNPNPNSNPDIASSDYYLFRFLENSLNGKKNAKICEDGIMKLAERW